MMAKFTAENQRDWDVHLPLLMMAYRTAVHETTGCTPSMLMLGREAAMPVDLLMGHPPEDPSGTANQSEYAGKLLKRMETVHRFARQHLKHETERQKRYYDHRGVRCNHFNRGDAVWLHNPKRKKGRSPKLQNDVYEGPFLVLSQLDDVTYRIQKGAKTKPKVVHHNRLKPYEGTNAPTWLDALPTEETTGSPKSGEDPCVPSPCSYAGKCSKDNSSHGFQCSCMPGYKGRLCETDRLGWSTRKPGISCKHILSSGDAKHDGKYWIDPENAGNAIHVYCDMSTEGGGWLLISNVVIPNPANAPTHCFTPTKGGWLLISNVVIPNPANAPSASLGSTYRHIANYNDNKTIISATALRELRQLAPFTQLRFHCRKANIGRTIHLITAANSTGFAVVDYFTATTNVRPSACHSFYRGPGDNSMLAPRCTQWGYSGLWGSNTRINDLRIHDHAFFVALKYHWISKPNTPRCDAMSSVISPGDYWKIYVQ
ncbi:hypothetical protein QZH41_007793 [Actinostola sp. cb2023]|nr:hypothetical protein QZH41_007793 [Actinostola sp. cb2023]